MVEEGISVPDPGLSASTRALEPPQATTPIGVVALVRLASLLIDPDGRIAYWSRSAEELFGHRSDTVLGRTASGLLAVPRARPEAAPALGRLRREARAATERFHLRPGGSQVRKIPGPGTRLEEGNLRL